MELNPPVLAHWLDLDMLSRLGVAALLGLLLGLDREIHGHPAGLGTHGVLISVGMLTVFGIVERRLLPGDEGNSE